MKPKNFPSTVISHISQALLDAKKTHSKLVAAFDADGTLWSQDLGESFFKFQIRHELLPHLKDLTDDPWAHYRKMKASGDPRPAYLWLAQINQGQSLDLVRSWAEDHFNRIDSLNIFEEQRSLIDWLHTEGVHVYVITASVKWAVEPGALRLGIPNERVLGVATQTPNGIINDVQEGQITYREGKPQALLTATLGQAPFFACGNTLGDIELLRSATHSSLAVRSATKEDELYETEEKLYQEALQKNWLNFQF